ncbi:MAG: hypothetical protein ACE5LU_25240, partial [Anaerolineae bacterium]
MILTNKVCLRPSADTISTLWYISRCCNRAWNRFIEQRREAYAAGRRITKYDQKKRLPTFKREDERFRDPSSQTLQEVTFTVDDAYESFFAKRKNGDEDARPPGFRSSRRFFTQRYPQRGTSFEIEDGRLGLAFGCGRDDWLWVDLPEGNYDDVTTCRISYDRVSRN